MKKDEIQNVIENIFTHANCAISKVDFSEEGGMIWCMIETPDSRFMIGKDGETLRSLNHVVRKILEKSSGEGSAAMVFLDINNYQKKKVDSLRTTAHMMAERARYFKSNIQIDPMPAFERRIVHMFLENAKDIKTESEGTGPDRRIIIKYIAD